MGAGIHIAVDWDLCVLNRNFFQSCPQSLDGWLHQRSVESTGNAERDDSHRPRCFRSWNQTLDCGAMPGNCNISWAQQIGWLQDLTLLPAVITNLIDCIQIEGIGSSLKQQLKRDYVYF